MAYFFTSVDSTNAPTAAAERLASLPPDEILLIGDKTISLDQIDHIFTDADGTIVTDGATAFSPQKISFLRDLSKARVGVTLVTGKPYDEVRQLRDSLPDDVPLEVLCEKGAYLAKFEDGEEERELILSSLELEDEVATLKQHFFETIAPDLTARHGVYFGLSGSGKHRSVLGIDFFAAKPPANYLELIGEQRDALKITDSNVIQCVEDEIAARVRSLHPDWRVVHLGGSNTEIAPGPIEKDLAIQKTADYHDARQVLILGDSRNDQSMFRLSRSHADKVTAGLVVARESALPLIDDVDLVVFGGANTDPILQAVIDARNNR